MMDKDDMDTVEALQDRIADLEVLNDALEEENADLHFEIDDVLADQSELLNRLRDLYEDFRV